MQSNTEEVPYQTIGRLALRIGWKAAWNRAATVLTAVTALRKFFSTALSLRVSPPATTQVSQELCRASQQDKA